MNIRDYKKAEPLLKKYEALCKEIGFLKKNAALLVSHEGQTKIQLPIISEKKKVVAKKEVDDGCYSYEDIHRRIHERIWGGFGCSETKEEEAEVKDVVVSETAMIKIHALLISELVEERKRVAEELKSMGLHYSNQSA